MNPIDHALVLLADEVERSAGVDMVPALEPSPVELTDDAEPLGDTVLCDAGTHETKDGTCCRKCHPNCEQHGCSEQCEGCPGGGDAPA